MSGDPLVLGSPSPGALDEQLLVRLWTPAPWFGRLLGLSFLGACLFLTAATYTVFTGIGTWGNAIPVAWAFGIVNFVWWIGIGHAGTFISAFLVLLEQDWRASINRFAEAMTLFALANAAMFPLLHLGRPWFAYWFLPYPGSMGVWPQYRSALVWDVAAISSYLLVSLLFFYTGLIPDLASARDRAPERWRRRLYGIFALGWRGSARHWHHYRKAYLLMAGVATPLVVSVHSIVSLDFATGLVPGWHSTIFPPYFVIGALHSGFAMVLVLLVPAREALGLHLVVTPRHLDAVARMLLTMALLMTYCYVAEQFVSWYGNEPAETHTSITERMVGSDAWVFWPTLALNCLVPQVLWFWRSPPILVGVGLSVLLGMWLERYLIVIRAMRHDFLPSSWGGYVPTLIDGSLFVGSLSLFLFLFLLFLRFVPFVPVSEVKKLAHEEGP